MNGFNKRLRDDANDRNYTADEWGSLLLPHSEWLGVPHGPGAVATGFADDEEQRLQVIREVLALLG